MSYELLELRTVVEKNDGPMEDGDGGQVGGTGGEDFAVPTD